MDTRSLLLNYMLPVDAHHPARIRVVEQEAIDIVSRNDDPQFAGSAEVTMSNGEGVPADRVLLATGNQPPARRNLHYILGRSGTT